jgi:hypothetical protein
MSNKPRQRQAAFDFDDDVDDVPVVPPSPPVLPSKHRSPQAEVEFAEFARRVDIITNSYLQRGTLTLTDTEFLQVIAVIAKLKRE